MKKTYNAPQMKLIEVKDDIIATSPQQHDQIGFGTPGGFIQERNGMWDDDFDAEDVF